MDTTMENVAVASAEARRQLESGSGSPGGFGGETPGAANPRTPGAHLAPSPLTLGYGATYDYEDPMDPSFVPKTPGLPADYQSDQEGIDMASVIAQADESHAQYEHQHSRVPENDLDPRVIARRQSAYDRNGATLETSPNTDHFFQRFSSPTTHPYTSSAYGASSTIAGVGSIDVPSFHIGSAQHRSPNGFQNGNDQYSAYSYRASRMGSDDVFTAPALPASAYNSYGSGARQRTLMQPGYSGPSTGNLHSLSMNSQDGETDYSELLPAHESSRVTTRAPVNPARIAEPMIAALTGRESRPSSPAQEDLESDEPENQRMPAPRKRSAKAPSTPKSATKSTPKPTKSGKKPSGSSVASSEPRPTRAVSLTLPCAPAIPVTNTETKGPRAGKAVDNKVIPDTFEQCDLADRTLVEMRDVSTLPSILLATCPYRANSNASFSRPDIRGPTARNGTPRSQGTHTATPPFPTATSA